MGKRLRKIAQRLALRTCLFCVKPKMVGITEHSFEKEHGLIKFLRPSLTRARQRLYEPERTHVERTFLARKSINTGVRRVAVD